MLKYELCNITTCNTKGKKNQNQILIRILTENEYKI